MNSGFQNNRVKRIIVNVQLLFAVFYVCKTETTRREGVAFSY